MALQPSLNPLIIAGTYDAPHTLDIFLDYVCPFSAKLSRTMDTVLKPWFDKGGKYYGKVKLIMRPQVQPWHASSTFTHEAGLAFARVDPEHFWEFARKLFDKQEDYYDVPSANMTPVQIREKLAELAASVLKDPSKIEAFKEILKIRGGGLNTGVAVTDDLKYTIKFSRQNGVHVSPSALWDGVLVPEVSSSWGEAEWAKFLSEKVKA